MTHARYKICHHEAMWVGTEVQSTLHKIQCSLWRIHHIIQCSSYYGLYISRRLLYANLQERLESGVERSITLYSYTLLRDAKYVTGAL